MNLRKHQQQAVSLAKSIAAGTNRNTTSWAHVVPGGGKSWLPPLMLNELGPQWKLAWFVPRLNLAAQAEKDTLDKHNLRIRKSGNDQVPERDTRGFVTTVQSLERNPDNWVHALSRGRWLVFVDEMHHFKETRDGVLTAFSKALQKLPYTHRVLMTGTTDTRSDLIYLADYDETREGWQFSTECEISYTRREALQESAIVTVDFEHHDGPVRWDEADRGEVEERLSSAKGKDMGKTLTTALRTGFAGQLLTSGLSHFDRHGTKLLVVAAGQPDAKSFAKKLRSRYGNNVFLAISDEDAACDQIKAFRESHSHSILITCQMAYEGLDVPEISHGICLTNIRSTSWITQMLARAWRKQPGKDRCFWFVPDDPYMAAIISRIKAEESGIVPFKQRDGNSGEGGGGPESFVPLHGVVDEVRMTGMDGAHKECESLLNLLADNGWTKDAALRVLNNGSRQTAPTFSTYSEETEILRGQLTRACNDGGRKYFDGDYQRMRKQVFSYMKKPVEDYTNEDFKRATHYVQKNYPA